jgi:hypothetical protein
MRVWAGELVRHSILFTGERPRRRWIDGVVEDLSRLLAPLL